MVRAELVAGIDNQLLEVIPENKNVIWEEEGQEFSLNGDFYDVIKIERKGDQTYLHCVNDKKEEQLIKNYARAIKSNRSGKNSKRSSKHSIIDQNLLADIQIVPLMHECTETHSNFKESLSTGQREIIIPPPRV